MEVRGSMRKYTDLLGSIRKYIEVLMAGSLVYKKLTNGNSPFFLD